MYKKSSVVVYWWKHQHTESESRVKVDHHLAHAFEQTVTIHAAATTSLTFTNLKLCMPYFFLVEVVYQERIRKEDIVTYTRIYCNCLKFSSHIVRIIQ